MRTSYSAIETYRQCPQKYKFQEIDRIKVPKGCEAIFGSLMHNVLKFVFRRDPLFPTLDEVIAYFREHWPGKEIFEAESRNDPLRRSWTEEEEKIYFEEGVKMLKRFYEKNAPWNFTILDLESRFEIALLDEKSGETHVLAGIIDRIDKLPDGKYEIIDYKTSKRMPSQNALDKNLQLALYSLGLQKRWPHLTADDIKLSLYFLKHGEKLSTQATEESTRKIKEKVLKTISEIQGRIQSGKEFEPIPSPLCEWCAYRPMCPAWKHLYRKTKDGSQKTEDEIGVVLKEYFEIKNSEKQNEARLKELQDQIKIFMEREGLTRVFGGEGVVYKKTIQRYDYDWGKIKSVLSSLGKWDEVLKVDETKLKKVLLEVPEEIRAEVEATRHVKKEYTAFTVAFSKTKIKE